MMSKFAQRARRNKRNHYKNRFSAPFRLSVFRSNCHFYAQLIKDEEAHTVFSVSTLSKDFEANDKRKLNTDTVSSLGDFFNKNIPDEYKGSKAVFDKSGYLYHGLVKTFAEKVREVLNF